MIIQRRNIVVAAALGAMIALAPAPSAAPTPGSGCGCCCVHQNGPTGQNPARAPRRRRVGRARQVHIRN